MQNTVMARHLVSKSPQAGAAAKFNIGQVADGMAGTFCGQLGGVVLLCESAIRQWMMCLIVAIAPYLRNFSSLPS